MSETTRHRPQKKTTVLEIRTRETIEIKRQDLAKFSFLNDPQNQHLALYALGDDIELHSRIRRGANPFWAAAPEGTGGDASPVQ